MPSPERIKWIINYAKRINSTADGQSSYRAVLAQEIKRMLDEELEYRDARWERTDGA